MFQKLNQPFVVQRIEEASKVRIQNPIHSPPLDAHRQRIERLMGLPSGTETVAESSKVHLVNFIQDGYYGLLNDLILQRRNADRPLSAVRFR
jgi:hypothetical protein